MPHTEARLFQRFLKSHWLTMLVLVVAIFSFLLFTWGEYGYFCDQAKSHHEQCSGFWSLEHMHDWIYNMASNWQSELLFGVLLVVLLHKAKGGDT